ncbi:cytochrome b N-terminal domain-containing protein [Desulforhopalus singaporensis]|uniref:Ubiquinol-cytochrome c reductase cytochrome b subunit n=1 Tax=Desulforhopalus singaporensis TaxID=91360 RepID=A0A1H0MNZ5_9BACT|nr:cytochrome b N-terminal domain-containing protein [Desulforhopalus singaporensis]SDO82064.1 ubiquinol-cytochrome c reductase cytochrome b subunit [Desulforhopalus singaporensis]
MWSRRNPFVRPVTLVKRDWLNNARDASWGAWALMALYISLFSGIIVGLQYDWTEPFYSTAAIDLLVPFGEFFRSLHFYSSQLFFFLSCIHLLAVYSRTTRYETTEWLKLIISLVVIVLLLFTGYILRGDITGYAAGNIAEGIMRTIPLAGPILNSFLFSLSDNGLQRVYVHHVIGLDIALLMLLWKHLRLYRVKAEKHLPLICFVLFYCALFPAPMDPESLGITYIAGPWFFLGLQELLRYLHPFLAGVATPAIFLAALAASHPDNRNSRFYLRIVWGWLFIYGIFSAAAWMR